MRKRKNEESIDEIDQIQKKNENHQKTFYQKKAKEKKQKLK